MSLPTYTSAHKTQSVASRTSKTYDVFLSFQGEPIRKTFVDHLHASLKNAGFNAFLDSQNVNKGDEISSTIQDAIENSSILIPIFTKNYAESHWCLDLIAHMCRCSNVKMPLFYDVKPTEVRNPERGAFAKAFEKKKGRYSQQRISEWKAALSKVSSFAGWCTDDTLGFEAGLVKLVVHGVFKTLQKMAATEEDIPDLDSCDQKPSNQIKLEIRHEPLRIPKHVFSMEEQMSEVIEMLKIDSDEDVLTVAIYGRGGVGKTSLAKAIHNHIYLKFDASCLVYDVRHKAQHANGISKMQRQILKDLVKFKEKVNDEDHGKILMKGHLRSIKALVILEYVDDSKQLEALRGDWFGPGTRVLVTTIDPNLLNKNIDFAYELQGLHEDQALQFLSWHAFMRDKPDKGYEDLSLKVVNICNRLRLSLEVLGAHLYEKDVSYWNQTIEMIKYSSYQEKYVILRFCYNVLNSEQKEMFLDMACFFIGRKRDSVISFWEASHLYPNLGLTNMILKSLIKLDEDDRFVMHSELRDMGRSIVAEESVEPGKRSRLWKQEEVELVLMEGKGTESVICLTYLQQEVKLPTNSLQRMCNLQLLWLDGAFIEGDFRQMPPDLKWLRWKNCPLKCIPSEWNMQHLVVLDLSFSQDIEAVWSDQFSLEGPRYLKVLKLNDCGSLKVLPDLANHTSLIQLELCGCKSLKQLPDSIGLLTELKYLDLSNCYSLTQLPDTMSNLNSLEVFFLSNCHKITELPDLFEELRILKNIKLDALPIKTLPHSFRKLSCLEKLSLRGCHELRSLPQPIGELNCLRHLDIHGCCNLQSLPNSIYKIDSLCYLDMTDCKKISLRPDLGNLVRMDRLIVSNCFAISSLPSSIGQLSSLRHLNLNHCKSLFRLPEELGNLASLEELLLNKCSNLCEIPQSIGKLSMLRNLEMEENYSLSLLPSSFSKITSLKLFKAGGCPLPQDIGKFLWLEVLHLKSYKSSSLPPSFSKLPHLRKLSLYYCTEFLELPHLPKELVEVHIQDCLGLRRITSMSHMERLKLLRIHNCADLVELPHLGRLQSLQEISISECKNVRRIQGVEGWNSLRRLHVPGCRLGSPGCSTLIPGRLIKEAHCLELFSFSANSVPECLEHKMESNEDDLLYITVDSNEQCSGFVLCFVVRFKSGITSLNIALSASRDGVEVFNTKLTNHSKNVEGDQIFVHILRKNHPLARMVQSGDVVRAKAEGYVERKLIRSVGMQFFTEGEDGKREELLLETLGEGLNRVMEDYNENLEAEDE